MGGGVEKLWGEGLRNFRGLRNFEGGVEKFSGGGGLRNFRGGGGGLRNFREVLGFFREVLGILFGRS